MCEFIFNENELPSVSIEGFSDVYEKMLRTVLADAFSFEGSPKLRITSADLRVSPDVPTIIIGSRQGKKNNLYYLRRPVDLSQFHDLAVSLVSETESPQKAEITVDHESFSVSYMKASVSLSELEFKLFLLLHEKAGEIVSRDEINAHLWNGEQASNVCDVYVCYLRKKLSSIFGLGCISSVRGKGYTFIK